MENIQFSSKIKIEHVPVNWIPKIELFYPDLPGFPIMYVHTLYKGSRVYGFPVTFSITHYYEDNKTCDIEFLFLCNKNFKEEKNLKKVVKQELENRIGLSDAITKDDILKSCKDLKYKNFFSKLFDTCSRLYGLRLPYGRFYEEIYSIVRFVATFNPKTGRQSEMRMLYNFLREFGEEITIEGDKTTLWSFLEFYLLPTYTDLKNNMKDFPKFNTLIKVLDKIWESNYEPNKDCKFRSIKNNLDCWAGKREFFVEEQLNNLLAEETDKDEIKKLVDAFNRYPTRASFFVWTICTLKEVDFKKINIERFLSLYNSCNTSAKDKKIRGCSPKVLACCLQQGFLKSDIIPVDTWVYTFYKYALGINNVNELFKKFENLGKIERLIWLSSQANKVNSKVFKNLLWCQRYGINQNKEFRMANPIACYECGFRKNCVGYEKIQEQFVYVTEHVTEECIYSKKKNSASETISYKILKPSFQVMQNSPKYICSLENKIPKKIGILSKKNKEYTYKLIDEFSSYILNNSHMFKGKLDAEYSVNNFIKKLPE